MQGSNFTPALQAAGLRAPDPLIKVWDINGAFGGPIRKDRLWFFGNVRTQGTKFMSRTCIYNKNAGDPTQVDLRAGPEPTSLLGPDLGECEPAADVAGDADATRSAFIGTSRRYAGVAPVPPLVAASPDPLVS